MDMGFFLQKERIFPGAHKIGAAISGPRIADKTFYGHEDFSDCSTIAQRLRNRCPRSPEKQGEVSGNQLFTGTIALLFVNY